MSGGLFDPLGTDRGPPAPRRAAAPALAVAAALAALATLAAVSWLRDDGNRGRPIAVAPIDRVAVPPRPAPPLPATPEPPPAAAPPAPTAAPGLPPVAADQDVEVQNGVRIVRPRRAAPGAGGQTLAVPAAR